MRIKEKSKGIAIKVIKVNDFAQRALDTVDNVNDTVSDLQDAARDALADDGTGAYRQSAREATTQGSAAAADAEAAQPGDAKA